VNCLQNTRFVTFISFGACGHIKETFNILGTEWRIADKTVNEENAVFYIGAFCRVTASAVCCEAIRE
jgi:hypothetical protein